MKFLLPVPDFIARFYTLRMIPFDSENSYHGMISMLSYLYKSVKYCNLE